MRDSPIVLVGCAIEGGYGILVRRGFHRGSQSLGVGLRICSLTSLPTSSLCSPCETELCSRLSAPATFCYAFPDIIDSLPGS